MTLATSQVLQPSKRQGSKMPPFLEIACFNPISARIAAAAGADRIEFCADGSVGGITPSLADFIALKQEISIPIYVMIRPRGGNFDYTDEEFKQMKDNIIAFREASADGLVLGILKAEGKVDIERCKELVRLAGPRKCTFHRAFDEIIGSWEEAISDIEECGFSTILTSAGKPTALLGSEQLKSMVAYHASPDIIVGGGVRSGHLKDLHEKLQANWYHSSAVIDGGDTASAEEVKALREALGR